MGRNCQSGFRAAQGDAIAFTPRLIACDEGRIAICSLARLRSHGDGRGYVESRLHDIEQTDIRDAAEHDVAEIGTTNQLTVAADRGNGDGRCEKPAPVDIHTLIILSAMPDNLSRRSLVFGSSLLWGMSAAGAEAKLQYLDPATAAEIENLAAQIIPSDDSGPGAKEAGVIYFIDRALATFDEDKRPVYREGLAAARGKQLAEIEHTEFFETLRRHTIMGFLASPAWGGNRDKAGWKLIGFEDRGMFDPPFGYYDAPEHQG